MWLLLTDQCLQVRLLSGTFIIRSSSSLESMENTNIYLGPNQQDLCTTFYLCGLSFDADILPECKTLKQPLNHHKTRKLSKAEQMFTVISYHSSPCWCFFVCSQLTKAFRTACGLSAGDVGAGQYWTLLPLTLRHTMLWRTSEEDGDLVKKGKMRGTGERDTRRYDRNVNHNVRWGAMLISCIMMPDHKASSTMTGMLGCEEVKTMVLLDSAY